MTENIVYGGGMRDNLKRIEIDHGGAWRRERERNLMAREGD